MLEMDIHAIRLANARALLRDECDDVIAKFAERLGKSHSQASQLVGRGERSRKPMGRSIARQIEEAFGRPDGWMDQVHEVQEAGASYSHLSPQMRKIIDYLRGMGDDVQNEARDAVREIVLRFGRQAIANVGEEGKVEQHEGDDARSTNTAGATTRGARDGC